MNIDTLYATFIIHHGNESNLRHMQHEALKALYRLYTQEGFISSIKSEVHDVIDYLGLNVILRTRKTLHGTLYSYFVYAKR